MKVNRNKTQQTRWFVSRHRAAICWLTEQLGEGRVVQHLLPQHLQQLGPDHQIYGTLPVDLAAAVCKTGAHYYHLCLNLPASRRGMELDLAQLRACKPQLCAYRVVVAHNCEEPE